MVAREYEQYRSIHLHCGELLAVMPEVEFSVVAGCPVLSMPRIRHEECGAGAERHAHAILSILKRSGRPCQPGGGQAFEYLSKGIEAAKAVLEPERMEVLSSLAYRAVGNPVRVGPVYGDFHHENILCEPGGRYYLVDPAFFLPQGVQAYDALHYVAYRAWKDGNGAWSNWMNDVLRCHQMKWAYPGCEQIIGDYVDLDLELAGVFYAVCRLGQLSLHRREARSVPERVAGGLRELLRCSERASEMRGNI